MPLGAYQQRSRGCGVERATLIGSSREESLAVESARADNLREENDRSLFDN